MAGFKSTYDRNNYLKARYNNGSFPGVATLYCALFSTMPTKAGGGTEISGNGYARVAKTANTTNFPEPTDGQVVNGTLIDFGTPTGSGWGTLAGAGIYDSSTGGNLIHAGPFVPTRTGTPGLPFYIPVGGFVATETDG